MSYSVSRLLGDKLGEHPSLLDGGADPSGTTDASSIISSAVSTFSGGATVDVPSGTYRVSNNTTVKPNVHLDFARGGKVSVDSGKTLTIMGTVTAGRYQIFSGSGAVKFLGSTDQILPEWFGAVADCIFNRGSYGEPSLTIIGCSGSGTNIVLQTSTAHGYSAGDTVAVQGVGGNTAANTTAVIGVVDSTHFNLVGVTGSGSYTSGGTCQRQQSSLTVTASSGATSLTIGSSFPVSPVAGQTVYVKGGGSGGADYFGTVTSFSGGALGITPALSSSVTGALCMIGTDNTSAMNAAVAAAYNAGVRVSLATGNYLCTGTVTLPRNVSLVGHGPGATAWVYTGAHAAIVCGDLYASVDNNIYLQGARVEGFSMWGTALSGSDSSTAIMSGGDPSGVLSNAGLQGFQLIYRNLAIFQFGVVFAYGTNAYLMGHEQITTVSCGVNVLGLSGSSNNGENMYYSHCVFSNGYENVYPFVWGGGTADFFFSHCSFDYNLSVEFHCDSSHVFNATLSECHLEKQRLEFYRTETTSDGTYMIFRNCTFLYNAYANPAAFGQMMYVRGSGAVLVIQGGDFFTNTEITSCVIDYLSSGDRHKIWIEGMTWHRRLVGPLLTAGTTYPLWEFTGTSSGTVGVNDSYDPANFCKLNGDMSRATILNVLDVQQILCGPTTMYHMLNVVSDVLNGKFFRLIDPSGGKIHFVTTSSGGLSLINQAYSGTIFTVDDSGNVFAAGNYLYPKIQTNRTGGSLGTLQLVDMGGSDKCFFTVRSGGGLTIFNSAFSAYLLDLDNGGSLTLPGNLSVAGNLSVGGDTIIHGALGMTGQISAPSDVNVNGLVLGSALAALKTALITSGTNAGVVGSLSVGGGLTASGIDILATLSSLQSSITTLTAALANKVDVGTVVTTGSGGTPSHTHSVTL